MHSSEQPAIVFDKVSKVYKLYQSNMDRFRDIFKLGDKVQAADYYALDDVSLSIPRGGRLALVGRNGAGKTTLLKLITQNFAASSGKVIVNGSVQALMSTGLGFHPEFTGLENIKSSLKYNGLGPDEFAAAVDEIIDFVELGDFINQPMKTYSQGMQSRLQFATATAIKPDILIIDEVLGAGDAYFSAKCADRMEKLTNSGCTLLLVSHSTAQVLQFCDKAVWLECGKVVLDGEALDVVKAYEEYTKQLEYKAEQQRAEQEQAVIEHKILDKKSVIQSKWLREKLLSQVLAQHQQFPNSNKSNTTKSAQISRWPRTASGLIIEDLSIYNAAMEPCYSASTNEVLKIIFTIKCEESGDYPCTFVLIIFGEDGRWITRHCSPEQNWTLQKDQVLQFSLSYDQLLLGNGKYIFSAAIYKQLDLANLSSASYYDLLSRSFEFEVQSKYRDDMSLIHHPGSWDIEEIKPVEEAVRPLQEGVK